MKNFKKICNSCIINETQKPLTIQKDSKKWFNEQINTHFYIFDYFEEVKAYLSNLKKDQVIDFYKKMFVAQRKICEVHMISKKQEGGWDEGFKKRSNCELVKDIPQWQKQQDRYDDMTLFKGF